MPKYSTKTDKLEFKEMNLKSFLIKTFSMKLAYLNMNLYMNFHILSFSQQIFFFVFFFNYN